MTELMAAFQQYSREQFDQWQQQDAMMPVLFHITQRHWETGLGDVFTWELEADSHQPFQFAPGQFNMLLTPGVGEVPISISGDAESGRLIHTTRAVGPVTQAMKQLTVGDTIGIRGPFGSAWPTQEAEGKDVILITGGIGLAPMRPTLYHILNHREKYGKVYLIYGARSPHEMIFRGELETWEHDGQIQVITTVDRAEGQWHGRVGVVTNYIAQCDVDSNNCIAMMCGPEIMMHFSAMTLNKLGIGNDKLYVSMERNMKCAVGHCGHCQWGPSFICKDGPVYRVDTIEDWLKLREF